MTIDDLLRVQRAKLDEIIAALVVGQDEASAIEEAEPLIENWRLAMLDDQTLKPATKLQHLLAAHHEISARIRLAGVPAK